MNIVSVYSLKKQEVRPVDVLLTEWQEALKEQSRKKELTAHIIEQQKIVVSEAVEALEKRRR